MKKLLGLLLMGVAIFSSCGNDHEDLYDPNAAALLKANEYSKAFVKQFGNIDPNHTWGFGSQLGSRAGWMNMEANMWAGYVDVPDPLTDTQKEIVTKWFENNKNPQSVAVQWSEYFAQHVSSSQYGSNMNQLKDGDGTHLNNFNGGDQGVNTNVWSGELTNPNDPNSKVYYSDKILYVKGGNTSSYSYQSGDGKDYSDFVIVPGDMIDSSFSGMFFLGFDYSCTNPEIALDGYYNDWIIKLTPCEYIQAKRIIAEDLGTIGDFDFNDVVFDAYMDGNDAVITLQAAGGTLPLYIADQEVHELFGVDTNVMVNTGRGATKTPVIFRVSNCTNILDVKIYVEDGENKYELVAARGMAPQKICVGTDFVIPVETQNINELYNFDEYVADENVELKKRI